MSTRVDAWIWAIRLTKTRSAAGAACRGGHVRVNGVTAKPAQPVVVGDEVRLRLDGQERIVEVTTLISKRVSAPLAAECYIDRSPPPPSRELLASAPRRDRGSGRPTKRERRQLDQLRRGGLLTASAVRIAVTALILAMALTLGACSSDDSGSDPAKPATPQAPGRAGDGPLFGACGGVTSAEVSSITRLGVLTNTINNPSVCEWDSTGTRTGPVASFNWYRGSPIGRERATEQLSRASTTDIEINGHRGFIANDGQSICEVGIGFGADFFEWSVSAGTFNSALTIQQICDATRQLSRLSVERAQ